VVGTRKYVTVFTGTFFLVFTVGMVSIALGVGDLAPLATGTVLPVMVCAVGPISVGACNPAFAVGITPLGLTLAADIWTFFTAKATAGALAAFVFGRVGPELAGAQPPPFGEARLPRLGGCLP
jgi:aquaporin Z